jgi:hypothetical protein
LSTQTINDIISMPAIVLISCSGIAFAMFRLYLLRRLSTTGKVAILAA